MKGGQAQGPLVKSVHIPLLSEGIQANPGLLRRKGALITQISIKKTDYFNIHPIKNQMAPYMSLHTCRPSTVFAVFLIEFWDHSSSLLILVSTRDI